MLDSRQWSSSWFASVQRQRHMLLSVAVVGLSLAIARLVLAVDIVTVAALAVVAALGAVAVRPRYGVYLLFAIDLFFDGVSIDPVMLPGRYINFSLQTTLNLTGAILIPIEMLLLLTTAIWLAQAAMRRQVEFRSGFLGPSVLALAFFLLFGVARGLASGGNFNIAFWESRFLFSMVLCYIVVVNTIRTRAHVRTLLAIMFIAVAGSAADGVWRKFALIDAGLMGSAQETWYSHEDVVIWGLMIMLTLSQAVFGGPRWQRIMGPLLVVLAVFAMLVSERRAGLIAVMIAIVVFILALAKINRKAFVAIAVPVALGAAIYLPLFWNNTSTLGQGARAVRSLSSPDPRDAASNMWRDLEAINVRATIQSDPIIGIGFGRPFLQVVTVPDISFFEFWNYEAHHNILWVWMKLGAIGFATFFMVLFGGIARAIWLARVSPYPEVKTFAMVAVGAIAMSLVYCYVDLALSGPRLPTTLGVILGTIAVLDKIEA